MANEERPKQGRRVQERALQYFLPPELRRAVKRLANDLGEDVERERVLSTGPLSGYVMRWFLAQPREAQLKIVLAGRDMETREKKPGDPPPSVQPDSHVRRKNRDGKTVLRKP